MFISLSHCNDVKEFIKIAQDITGNVEVKSGKYVVDGKSILGIFSLDLSQPVELVCESENEYLKFKKFESK